MKNKEIEPFVSHDMKTLVDILSRKKKDRTGSVRQRILKLNEDISEQQRYVEFKKLYDELNNR